MINVFLDASTYLDQFFFLLVELITGSCENRPKTLKRILSHNSNMDESKSKVKEKKDYIIRLTNQQELFNL